MDVTLAQERAYYFKPQLSLEQAEGRAWGKKQDAFGTLSKVTSLVQRPKDAEFELLYKEARYEPFWNVECRALYVYQRRRNYPIPVGGPEVETVTIEGMKYQVSGGELTLSGLEHCREEFHENIFINGISNAQQPSLADYTQFPATEIPEDRLDHFGAETEIVVPPQARASAIVREILIGMIKSVEADRILEDNVEVERVDLYYRPVYAFQYRWKSKEKDAVLEMDGLTGTLQSGGKTFQQYMGKILDPEFLFDVGTETIDLLVPGGGLAMKLAKKGIDVARRGGKSGKN